MAGSALSLQWALDATATDAISVGRGLLMAATGDNVSILALLACEKFGDTLPASSMSLQKVASVLVPRTPAPIAFLRATVGFLDNDCAVRLGKSAAGVRFLAFAAALIPTAGIFQSAVTLDKMLRDSASDLTLVPPQQALRDLLKVLEPRAPFCGFFDTVVFCQRLTEEEIIPKILSENIPSCFSLPEIQHLKRLMLEGVPPPDTLAELFNTFRQIGRLGPATIANLTIRTGTGIPWLLAFTQWCLDVPISLSVGNLNVLAPANAKVHILVPGDVKDLHKRIRITTHHELDRLDSLIQTSRHDTIEVSPAIYDPATRLVTMGVYREHLLRMLGFDKCSLELLREAIEYSIPLFLSYSTQKISSNVRSGWVKPESEQWPEEPDHPYETQNLLRPYPRLHVVSRVAGKILSTNEALSFKKLDDGLSIGNLPRISRHLARLQKMRCHECNVSGRRDGSIYSEPWDVGYCSENHFFRSLALLTCEIFAISIFRDHESLFMQAEMRVGASFNSLVNGFQKVLECPQGGIIAFMPFLSDSLVKRAKFLVGHDDGTEEPNSDIVSCRLGQVVYHAILSTFRVEKHGYAELICLPGVLRYKGEKFDSVIEGTKFPSRCVPNYTKPALLQKDDILIPPNFEDARISWRVSISEEATLEATLSMSSEKIQVDAYPHDLLNRLSDASILETCAHSQDAPVEMIKGNIIDAPVWQPGYYNVDHALLYVVRVGRAADQLCFALASANETQPIVIGRGACFNCCVNHCRVLKARILLLCRC